MDSYDPIYISNNLDIQNRCYQFITCSEVVEHFDEPMIHFRKMWNLLSYGGLLGVMTQWHAGASAFANWYYAIDPTHKSFYNQRTFRYIATILGGQIIYEKDNIVLLQKALNN